MFFADERYWRYRHFRYAYDASFDAADVLIARLLIH